MGMWQQNDSEHAGTYELPCGTEGISGSLDTCRAIIDDQSDLSSVSESIAGISKKTSLYAIGIYDFDWALHPGGQAIINGAQTLLGLTDDQLRGTKKIYNT